MKLPLPLKRLRDSKTLLLCYACIEYTDPELGICEYCQTRIKDYREEDFASLRYELRTGTHSPDSGEPEIGFSSTNETSKSSVDRLFESHLKNFEAFLEDAKYLDERSLTRGWTELAAKLAVGSFPTSKANLTQFTLYRKADKTSHEDAIAHMALMIPDDRFQWLARLEKLRAGTEPDPKFYVDTIIQFLKFKNAFATNYETYKFESPLMNEFCLNLFHWSTHCEPYLARLVAAFDKSTSAAILKTWRPESEKARQWLEIGLEWCGVSKCERTDLDAAQNLSLAIIRKQKLSLSSFPETFEAHHVPLIANFEKPDQLAISAMQTAISDQASQRRFTEMLLRSVDFKTLPHLFIPLLNLKIEHEEMSAARKQRLENGVLRLPSENVQEVFNECLQMQTTQTAQLVKQFASREELQISEAQWLQIFDLETAKPDLLNAFVKSSHRKKLLSTLPVARMLQQSKLRSLALELLRHDLKLTGNPARDFVIDFARVAPNLDEDQISSHCAALRGIDINDINTELFGEIVRLCSTPSVRQKSDLRDWLDRSEDALIAGVSKFNETQAATAFGAALAVVTSKALYVRSFAKILAHIPASADDISTAAQTLKDTKAELNADCSYWLTRILEKIPQPAPAVEITASQVSATAPAEEAKNGKAKAAEDEKLRREREQLLLQNEMLKLQVWFQGEIMKIQLNPTLQFPAKGEALEKLQAEYSTRIEECTKRVLAS